jgi:hypothetical protein
MAASLRWDVVIAAGGYIMDKRARLEVEKMTTLALFNRAHARVLRLTSYGLVDMKTSEVRGSAEELEFILRELRKRCDQGTLFDLGKLK